MKLIDLKLNPNNPRLIKDAKFKKLCNSVRDFPKMMELRPIVIDRANDNLILGGNMRYLALKNLKFTEIPDGWVRDATELTEDEKRRFIIEDNMPFGEWDMDILANSFDTSDLIEWGFEENELGISPEEPQDAEPQIDRAEELNKKWQVKTGDLWFIGEHRLLCGDSTKAEDTGRVIVGKKVDMVFTDPPYGISVVSGKKVGGSPATHFGKIGGGNWVNSHEYPQVMGDESTETTKLFYKICIGLGIKDFILWGGNYFTDFLPPSRCWLVWDKQNTGNFADVELAWTSFDKSAKKYEWLWNGLSRQGNRKDELNSRIHPTQKPVGLAVNIMRDFPADVYFDGFLGSGSFMVATQNIGKIMVAIEKGVDWCAVILERMITAFPDLKIERIEHGR